MAEPFVHPYIPNTAAGAKAEMLATVGAASVDEFYADVPESLRLRDALDLPAALPAEQDLARHVRGILGRNRPTGEVLSFLGGGTYQHYVPTYDGFQAAATGLAMAGRLTGRRRVLVVSDVLPEKLSKVTDYVRAHLTLEHVATRDGVADVAAAADRLGDDVAAVWIETPSATGAVEAGIRRIADAAHAVGAVVVVGTDPVGYGVLTPPALQGADIVTGDIQSLGLHQWFGGAHAGFIAVHDDPRFVMELPSRLFGLATTDVEGEYGFGDVAYDRTSFAHREEGKEWVGTAAALWGIAAGVYLALMGPKGMAELGELILARTRYAQERLSAISGVTLGDGAVHLREFTVDVEGVTAAEIVAALRAEGIEPGIPVGPQTLLVCVTDVTSQSDIDRLVDAVARCLDEVPAAVPAPAPLSAAVLQEQNA